MPERATWAMLGIGFAFIGLIKGRRIRAPRFSPL
jgi:hypothetical protein